MSAATGVGPEGKTCSKCRAPAQHVCGRCKQLPYCSAECQKGDWPIHKKACKTQQEVYRVPTEAKRFEDWPAPPAFDWVPDYIKRSRELPAEQQLEATYLIQLLLIEPKQVPLTSIAAKLDSGAVTVDQSSADGVTLMHAAAMWDRDHIAKLLLSKGSKPAELWSLYVISPLHIAALRGSTKILQLLLDAGVSPNLGCYNVGDTNAEVYGKMVSVGLHADDPTPFNFPAAVAAGVRPPFRVHKEATADIERRVAQIRGVPAWWYPLHCAAMGPNGTQCAVQLLKRGAYIDQPGAKTIVAANPVILCGLFGRRATFLTLLAAGADLEKHSLNYPMTAVTSCLVMRWLNEEASGLKPHTSGFAHMTSEWNMGVGVARWLGTELWHNPSEEDVEVMCKAAVQAGADPTDEVWADKKDLRWSSPPESALTKLRSERFKFGRIADEVEAIWKAKQGQKAAPVATGQ